MLEEKSCGGVLFTRDSGEVRYVLIRQTNGVYGFPKGHMEPGETERETALREIREEVGLNPTLLEGFCATESYEIPSRFSRKTVVYFLGEFSGQKPVVQQTELTQVELLSYEDAMALLRFRDKRETLRKAQEFIAGALKQGGGFHGS